MDRGTASGALTPTTAAKKSMTTANNDQSTGLSDFLKLSVMLAKKNALKEKPTSNPKGHKWK